ncbi:MAG: hypothetical protein IK103_01180 [Bacteroidales bacterium]|nr:hypothetical protein [Bacteroidales bacterium]
MNTKQLYEQPRIKVLLVQTESFICQSEPGTGGGEGMDPTPGGDDTWD